jgi:hypothetical protein
MTALADTTATAGRTPAVGERKQLGTYTLSDGTTRQLVAQRIDGHVRLVDEPQAGRARRYVVERELEQDGYAALLALVADYLHVAGETDTVPAAGCPLDRYLERLS